MWIKHITIQNCRLLHSVSLELSPYLNIILGANASGKTSFLEALTILSKGRSFRTSHINQIISHEKDAILISASILKNDDVVNHNYQIGIEKSTSKTTIRINKKDIYSQAELTSYLPITVIHPNSIELITGTPSIRRSFIDWIAFYSYPDFHPLWKRYKHVLRQRNICLKSPKHHYAIDKWTEELVSLQPDLLHFRKKVINSLQPIVDNISSLLLGDMKVKLEFKTGFPKDVGINKAELLEHYLSKKETDLKLKRTSSGCHKCDFLIYLNDTPAIESASRGQLKLLTICLFLAQSKCISQTTNKNGILLIDDLSAELDSDNNDILLNYLYTLNKQLILTSTKDIIHSQKESKMFHVKHGEIVEYSENKDTIVKPISL